MRYFKEDAELVKRSRDASGQWHGKWAPINRMCQLAHNLLRLLVVGNRRCADTLQSIDAVEVLLKQLPSGWNPPVIEVFDALMRRGEGGEEAGKQLYDGTRLRQGASHAQPHTTHAAPPSTPGTTPTPTA